jgi:hypothetical protein
VSDMVAAAEVTLALVTLAAEPPAAAATRP